MKLTRLLVEKIGKRLVFGTDFSEVDHQYGNTRKICFHKPQTKLAEGNIVYITYDREKDIERLPTMLVGIREVRIISKHPDPDLLLDL